MIDRQCVFEIDGVRCPGWRYVGELCRIHWRHALEPVKPLGSCAASGCDDKVRANGLCTKHYHQRRRERLALNAQPERSEPQWVAETKLDEGESLSDGPPLGSEPGLVSESTAGRQYGEDDVS